MGKNPAFQFYPNDWTRDLEEHPLEIEGAWIRICCKLWWSETRGSSTKTLLQWSKILSTHHNKTRVILNYLGKNNIGNLEFLDNQNITITCRRMVSDEKIRKIRQEVGKLGGNPNLKTTPKILVNQKPTPSSPSSSPTPKKDNKNIYGESVRMTEEEYNKLLSTDGEFIVNKAIQLLSNYKLSSGKKYKSDYHAILTWALDKAKGAGNGSGQPTGRYGVRPTPQEDPSVIADVEAINAKVRLKQLAREIAQRSAISKAKEDA